MKRPKKATPHQDLKLRGPRRRGFVVTDARGEQTMRPLSGAGSALPAHATQHQFAGSDPIQLDHLAAPDDTTDLDATITAHGLLPKLSGDVGEVLRGDGTFGLASAWSVLTNGDPVTPELIWDSNGDVIMTEQPR